MPMEAGRSAVSYGRGPTVFFLFWLSDDTGERLALWQT